MEIVAIQGTVRKEVGKKSTKALRREGAVPCVIYGGKEVVCFSVPSSSFKHLIYTPDFKLAEISVGGSVYKCIVKDVQFHPLNDNIVHMDFLELVEGSVIKVDVPVRFTGSAPGEKLGGKLQQSLRRVKVKTTPEHLVDQVLVDISNMELGESIRVRDIKEMEGVEIVSAPGTPLASIEIPRALRSAEAAEAEEGAATAPAPAVTEESV